MFRRVFHNRCCRILDRRWGFVRFESSSTGNRKTLSEQADDLFKEFANTYGLKGFAMVVGGCVALVSLPIFPGSYKMSHFNDQIARQNKTIGNQNKSIDYQNKTIDNQNKTIDNLNKAIDKQNKTIDNQNEMIDNLNKAIDKQNKEINKQGKTINQHYEKIHPYLMAFSAGKEPERHNSNDTKQGE